MKEEGILNRSMDDREIKMLREHARHSRGLIEGRKAGLPDFLLKLEARLLRIKAEGGLDGIRLSSQNKLMGYAQGLGDYLEAFEEKGLRMSSCARPEDLDDPEVVLGYISGCKGERPVIDRGKITQRILSSESNDDLSLIDPDNSKDIRGWRLGFVAKSLKIGFAPKPSEVPFDSQSYDVSMQGASGELRPMPSDEEDGEVLLVCKKSLEEIFYEKDELIYRGGQKRWLARHGFSLIYAEHIRHPENFKAFKEGVLNNVRRNEYDDLLDGNVSVSEFIYGEGRNPEKKAEVSDGNDMFDDLPIKSVDKNKIERGQIGKVLGRLARDNRSKNLL